ncbi:MAG: TetR family transcriptional regulator [Sphingomonas sp.]|nr:TetR family transcriptional regulator [Sphingomonas sp.]
MAQESTANVVELSKGKMRLIKVAMSLFAEKGFDGVTVRDISTAAEVSVGLINHHFGSKEGLREAVDRYFIAQFEEVLFEQNLYEGVEKPAGLDSVTDRTEAWIARHIDDWDLTKAYMRRALLEGSDWGGGLFERFYQVQRTAMDRMDAEGHMRADVDRLWLPLLVVYMELGTLLLEPFVERVLGKSGFDRGLWRRRHRAYADLVYRGVRPEPKN